MSLTNADSGTRADDHDADDAALNATMAADLTGIIDRGVEFMKPWQN